MTRALALALVLLGCTPAPRPVHVDGGEACAEACAVRARLGCLEPALAPSCVETCLQATDAGLYRPGCVAHATSRDELSACPRVRCMP